MHYLIIKERNYLKDYIHKVSTFIVRQALQENIGTIVIGKLSHSIVNIDIGSQNNENYTKYHLGNYAV